MAYLQKTKIHKQTQYTNPKRDLIISTNSTRTPKNPNTLTQQTKNKNKTSNILKSKT